MSRKVVVLNVGWMKCYQGITTDDEITDGGRYVQDEGFGHEIFNFLPYKNQMYGYVQPTGAGKHYLDRVIKLENIDESAEKSDSVDKVLVVWVARKPVYGGSYVVGWFKNATVYRRYQQPLVPSNRMHKGEPIGFYVIAEEQDCTCLPLEDRTLRVPQIIKGEKGGKGQSNVWFADSSIDRNRIFRETLYKFVEEYEKPALPGDAQEDSINVDNFFDPDKVEDARKKIVMSIAYRQGQQQFREKLLNFYEGRCVISGCDVKQVLEAAHIIPYLGIDTNHIANGLLLRADLHTLFDLYLISVNPESMTVVVAPQLLHTYYEELSNKKLFLPEIAGTYPSKEALEKHFHQYCSNLS